jgi:hypothetical protein
MQICDYDATRSLRGGVLDDDLDAFFLPFFLSCFLPFFLSSLRPFFLSCALNKAWGKCSPRPPHLALAGWLADGVGG